MGIAQSFERRLEQFVEGFFARTFRSGLQPVELGRKIAREMERGKTVTQNGVVVANHFRVFLSPEDTVRFGHFESSLRQELADGLTDECRKESWRTLGPIQVEFVTDADLKLGRYVIESRIIEGSFAASQSARPEPDPPPAAPTPAARTPPPPPPAGGTGPRLESASGETLVLLKDRIWVGRLEDCAIQLDDPNVSRHHAEVTVDASGAWVVTDLGSTNGTYVNGIRIGGETPLQDGDQLSVGRNTVVFRT
ncbi:MAG: FHA domain-containing protein [Acidimicrobiia bacterium]|nr:FHA domain-containing protein [Acidimicrobiia bacterium]